jgi:hypothetical protein
MLMSRSNGPHIINYISDASRYQNKFRQHRAGYHLVRINIVRDMSKFSIPFTSYYDWTLLIQYHTSTAQGVKKSLSD